MDELSVVMMVAQLVGSKVGMKAAHLVEQRAE